MLSAEDVDSFALRRLGLSGIELRELAAQYAGVKIPCPACRSSMSPLRLKGEAVDLCQRCGAMWTDAGERARMERASEGAGSDPGVL